MRCSIKSSFPPDSHFPFTAVVEELELQSEKGILKLTCENALQFLPEQTVVNTLIHSKFNGADEKFASVGNTVIENTENTNFSF